MLRILVVKCANCGRLHRVGSWNWNAVNVIAQGIKIICSCRAVFSVPTICIGHPGNVFVQSQPGDADVLLNLLGPDAVLIKTQAEAFISDIQSQSDPDVEETLNKYPKLLGFIPRKYLEDAKLVIQLVMCVGVVAGGSAGVATFVQQQLKMKQDTLRLKSIQEEMNQLEQGLEDALNKYNQLLERYCPRE